jgi:hypothetical protein
MQQSPSTVDFCAWINSSLNNAPVTNVLMQAQALVARALALDPQHVLMFGATPKQIYYVPQNSKFYSMEISGNRALVHELAIELSQGPGSYATRNGVVVMNGATRALAEAVESAMRGTPLTASQLGCSAYSAEWNLMVNPSLRLPRGDGGGGQQQQQQQQSPGQFQKQLPSVPQFDPPRGAARPVSYDI